MLSEKNDGSDKEPTIPNNPDRRWGFIENGLFVAVPKRPLQQMGLTPPCSVDLADGPRHIIEEPEDNEAFRQAFHDLICGGTSVTLVAVDGVTRITPDEFFDRDPDDPEEGVDL